MPATLLPPPIPHAACPAAAAPSRRPPRLAVLLGVAFTLLVLPPAHAASPAAEPTPAESLAMKRDADRLQQTADRFVERALAGDARGSAALLSRALVDRLGEAAAAQALQQRVLPFFARGGQVGGGMTISRTTDAAGQRGFAYYMWLVDPGGTRRPFTVYVVDEGGTPVVANVVPDRRVEGRHP